MYVVYDTLKQLGVEDKEYITLFNKIDRVEGNPVLRDLQADHQLKISAKTGEGLDQLTELLESILRSRKVYLERLYPYSQAGKIQQIRRYGELLSEEYREDGIAVRAYVPAELFANVLPSETED